MCLKTNDYYSNGKYFSKSNLHRFVNNCACGQCEECLSAKRSEWYLRMYWEAKRIFDKPYKAFIVYDTMTYIDANLPHLSDFFEVGDDVDFSCVSKRDIQLFMKNLREVLYRRYKIPRSRLKYFIASEYGDDHVYMDDFGRMHKATTRPHYHGLFYCDWNADICDPYEFIKCVHYAWSNGNTDNYKTFEVPFAQYGKKVKDNIFGNWCSRNTDADLRAVTNYVSKYIRKSDKYTDLIIGRVYKVLTDVVSRLPKSVDLHSTMPEITVSEAMWLRRYFSKNFAQSMPLTYSEKQLYKDIKKDIERQIGVFHLQSQGFGMYALDNMSDEDEEYMIESGKVRIPDSQSDSGIREIPIPLYFLRKLYYNYRKSDDGRIQWYITDEGLPKITRMTYGKIARLGSRYENWFINLKQNNADELDLDLSDLRDLVGRLLDGREWSDLATYSLVFRGRIKYVGYTEYDAMPSVSDVLEIQNSYNVQTSDISYKRGDGSVSVVDDLPWNGDTKVDLKKFYTDYCINQDTMFNGERLWRNFDDLLDIIRWTSVPDNETKQYTQKSIIDLKERLRNYGYRCTF